MRTNAIRNFPRTLEESNPDHFAFVISDALTQISNALPQKIYHKITSVKGAKAIDAKIETKKKAINEKAKIFTPAYESYFYKVGLMSGVFHYLVINPLTAAKNPHFLNNLKIIYDGFRKFKFPYEKRSIVFDRKILDVHKLTPSLHTVDLSVEVSQAESRGSEIPEEFVTSAYQEPESQKEEATEQDSEEEDEDEIIYDDAYWAEENRVHQLRKKLSLTEHQRFPVSTLSNYEQDLYSFLEKSIYKYEKRKTRTLIKELKDLKFKVTVNKSGKGSLHYVSPTADNPLFGQDQDYAEAYFNVHLPHDKSDIVPSGYFPYFQSGFSNVFGLSPEVISTKLENPVL